MPVIPARLMPDEIEPAGVLFSGSKWAKVPQLPPHCGKKQQSGTGLIRLLGAFLQNLGDDRYRTNNS
jgi:hypothetical protein